MTINREYGTGKGIKIFPFNTDQWLSGTKWSINTDTNFSQDKWFFDPQLGEWIVNSEWRLKSLVQAEYNNEMDNNGIPILLPLSPDFNEPSSSQGSGSSYSHDELRRRKRHPLYDITTQLDRIKTTCSIQIPVIPKGSKCNYYFDNGSPSIFAVAAYGYCKLFG